MATKIDEYIGGDMKAKHNATATEIIERQKEFTNHLTVTQALGELDFNEVFKSHKHKYFCNGFIAGSIFNFAVVMLIVWLKS